MLLHVTVPEKEAQLREGIKVLAEDPDGAKGYNAFVNEPAEASARTTVDETANTAEFMATTHGFKTTLVQQMEERDLYLIMIHKELLAELMLEPVPTSFVRWRLSLVLNLM